MVDNSNSILERTMNEHTASEYLGVSVKCLQGWRQRNIGPKFYKISNRVRYLPSDLLSYLRACAVETEGRSTSQ
jgi:hypothetical protein